MMRNEFAEKHNIFVHEGNKFALAVIRSYTRMFPDGGIINLCGPPGSGKSMLLSAIDREFDTGSVLSMSFIDLVDEFIESLQRDNHIEWKLSFLKNDLIIVDDIFDLDDKPSTSSSLGHILLQHVRRRGGYVFLASSDPLLKLNDEHAFLKSVLFNHGIQLDLALPDNDTKIDYLKERWGGHLNEGDICELAEKSKSFRELDYGALRASLDIDSILGALSAPPTTRGVSKTLTEYIHFNVSEIPEYIRRFSNYSISELESALDDNLQLCFSSSPFAQDMTWYKAHLGVRLIRILLKAELANRSIAARRAREAERSEE